MLKDDALEESANLPAPEVIAPEVSADLEAPLEQFATIAEDLKQNAAPVFNAQEEPSIVPKIVVAMLAPELS